MGLVFGDKLQQRQSTIHEWCEEWELLIRANEPRLSAVRLPNDLPSLLPVGMFSHRN